MTITMVTCTTKSVSQDTGYAYLVNIKQNEEFNHGHCWHDGTEEGANPAKNEEQSIH